MRFNRVLLPPRHRALLYRYKVRTTRLRLHVVVERVPFGIGGLVLLVGRLDSAYCTRLRTPSVQAMHVEVGFQRETCGARITREPLRRRGARLPAISSVVPQRCAQRERSVATPTHVRPLFQMNCRHVSLQRNLRHQLGVAPITRKGSLFLVDGRHVSL